MLDPLYIPIEVLLSYQDRSGIYDAILGHISPSSFPCSSAFRVVFSFLHGVQSHCLLSFRRSEPCFVPTWRSEPLPIFASVFRAMLCFIWRSEPPFIRGLRHSESSCHTFSSTFRAIFCSLWRSEPSLSLLSLMFRVVFSSGVQSHYIIHSGVLEPCFHFCMAFRAIIHFRFGFQSHRISFVSAFRAVFSFLHGGQSHCPFSVLAFRAMFRSHWHSEPLSPLSLTFRVIFSISAFRAITISSLMFRVIIITSQYQRSESHSRFWRLEHHRIFVGIQSHRFPVLAFRAIITSSLTFRAIVITSQHQRSEPSLFSVWRSKPSSFSVLAFRVIIAFQFRRSNPSSFFSFGVQSHHYF